MNRYQITFAHKPPLWIWARTERFAYEILCENYATTRGGILTGITLDPPPASTDPLWQTHRLHKSPDSATVASAPTTAVAAAVDPNSTREDR